MKRKMRKDAIFGLVIIIVILIVMVMWFIYTSNSSGISDTSKEEVTAIKSEENNKEEVTAMESEDNIREIIIRSGEDKTEAEVLVPILDYFNVIYSALADLKSSDLTGLFEDSASENDQINQSVLDYLIKLRLSQSNDLHITNYLCGLSITDVSESEGIIEVSVLEDQTVNFAFISKVDSSSSGIKHTFFLEKGSNGYVIVEHTKDEDIFSVINEMAKEVGYSQGLMDGLLLEESSVLVEHTREKEEFNASDEKAPRPSAKNPYYSKDAVDYAMTWVDPVSVIRNEDEYISYDDYGGNCNNYISQCFVAGGIPMDYFGDIDTQWKWYGETVYLDEVPSGRSPAWAGVPEFYTYASENTGYGLVAGVGDNVYSGSAGDILQFAINGEWIHSVIITEVVQDNQGNVLDYLINSNTTDRINYPASAYGYSNVRLIKILGWNEE